MKFDSLTILSLVFLFGVGCAAISNAQTEFRTDENPDPSLPWYQLQPGKFPPARSAHYFAGELIGIDHVNRTGTLRTDRTDAQSRSHWDLPVDFEMLPFGSIWYRGSPAALRDIPIGTHLHGLFYLKAPEDAPAKPIFHNRRSIEADFTRVLQLEDDFSYYQRRNHGWRIDTVDLDANSLTATSIDLQTKEAVGQAKSFEILPSTRIWQGRRIATLADIAAGQVVQCNLTWATLYGPGRCTDIWLDQESRSVASQQQFAIHRQHQRERGLAGWVDEVDNQQRTMKVTLFDGVDRSLLEDFKPDTSVTAVVAEPSLRSYDQVNDRKSGPLLAVNSVPRVPGSSGVQIRFQPSLLLEGFRPGRIVRVFPDGWPVNSIPLEERLWPARD